MRPSRWHAEATRARPDAGVCEAVADGAWVRVAWRRAHTACDGYGHRAAGRLRRAAHLATSQRATLSLGSVAGHIMPALRLLSRLYMYLILPAYSPAAVEVAGTAVEVVETVHTLVHVHAAGCTAVQLYSCTCRSADAPAFVWYTVDSSRRRWDSGVGPRQAPLTHDPTHACTCLLAVCSGLGPGALPALLTPYISWRSGSHSTGGARWRPRASLHPRIGVR